jgi:hypothetical protein
MVIGVNVGSALSLYLQGFLARIIMISMTTWITLQCTAEMYACLQMCTCCRMSFHTPLQVCRCCACWPMTTIDPVGVELIAD